MQTRLSRASLAIVLFMGALAIVGSVPVWAADPADDSGGVGLVVTVSPGPTPTPTSPSAGSSGSGSNSSSGGSSGGSTTPTSAPVELPTEAIHDGFSLGGALYVSGMTSRYVPSLNPLDGTLETSFVVQNLTDESVDVRARFSVSNLFGGRIDRTDPAAYTLEAGKSLTIEGELHGLGQWTFVTGQFTLTPPHVVDGITLVPLTRDAVVVFPPWFILLVLLLGTAAFITVRWVQTSEATPPAEVPA
jgi:hypothetical protein